MGRERFSDSREESVLGSIPLPSYVISAVEPEDHIIRKYAFKASHTGMRSYIYNRSSVIGSQAEHSGMRTYFFSADTQEDMNGWVKAMNQAALMQNHTTSLKRPSETSEISEMPSVSECQAVPQTNHVNNYTETAPQPPVDLHLHSDGVVLQPADIHRETEQHCSFWNDTPNSIASEIALGGGSMEIEMDAVPPSSLSPLPPYSASSPTSAPPSRAPMRAPSSTASTLPPVACLRNGTPTLEPNGMGTGTYQRATLPPQVMDSHRQVQRRSALEQVEHWVKVQRADHKGPPSRGSTLPRHTPPTQPTFIGLEANQTLPKTPRHSPPTAARHGEYKYAQDRLSHFRLGPPDSQGNSARDGGGIGGPGTVWQLYEWQQRHQFRHGSPTAPLYTPAPDYPFGRRPPSTVPAPRPSSEVPRCVSVPPDPSDIPPLGPPWSSRALSPLRRPHTPADRVVVMPLGERPALDVPVAGCPRRAKSQLLNAATIDRRSMPPSGYITHTVSAPSLHGKTPEELTLLLIQLRRHQAKMASARHHTVTQMQHFNYSPSGPHLRTSNNNPLFSSGPSSLGSLLGPPGPMGRGSSSQVDDTYMQLKKDLEYLDLKVGTGDGESLSSCCSLFYSSFSISFSTFSISFSSFSISFSTFSISFSTFSISFSTFSLSSTSLSSSSLSFSSSSLFLLLFLLSPPLPSFSSSSLFLLLFPLSPSLPSLSSPLPSFSPPLPSFSPPLPSFSSSSLSFFSSSLFFSSSSLFLLLFPLFLLLFPLFLLLFPLFLLLFPLFLLLFPLSPPLPSFSPSSFSSSLFLLLFPLSPPLPSFFSSSLFFSSSSLSFSSS
uniref:PH domain-containing protein n=1 Tax=Hucho hucho TaxID=62062 RepID=A0A4W5MTW8_9TELE